MKHLETKSADWKIIDAFNMVPADSKTNKLNDEMFKYWKTRFNCFANNKRIDSVVEGMKVFTEVIKKNV